MTDQDHENDPLPPGVPEPPDPAKVDELRGRIKEDRASRRQSRRGVDSAKGQQARDIGFYTIIPMMMIAGPLVGYLLGKGLENVFGGEPWPAVVGMLVGVVAGFRQVFLMLTRKGKRK